MTTMLFQPPAESNVKLRDYQVEAQERIINAFRNGDQSTLLVMATGLGKTVVFAAVANHAIRMRPGKKVLVLAHREELVRQNAATIERVAQCPVAVEMANLRAEDISDPRVISASVQTCISGTGDSRRIHRFDPEDFSLVIIDEAHHAVATSYMKVLAHFENNPKCCVLGVTATPDRTDETALGEIFDSCAFEYRILEGVRDGWLVRPKQRVVRVNELDLSQCRTTAGDLNAGDLDRIVRTEGVLHGMVSATMEIAGDRRTLIFTTTVSHAEQAAEIINRHRPGSAAIVSANTDPDERRRLFRSFAEAKIQYLANVGIATEGWDDPALDRRGVQVVAVMRPTKSRSLYTQMVGRGLRPLPGTVDGIDTVEGRLAAIASSAKPNVTVLDFVGNAGRHKLVHLADALAGKEIDGDVVDSAESSIVEGAQDGDVDVIEELEAAEEEKKKELERERRRGIKIRAKYTQWEIDPFDICDLDPDRDAAALRGVPASDKQMMLLEKLRVQLPQGLQKKEASKIIDAVLARPSPAQSWFLIKHGRDPQNFDRKSASAEIGRIKGTNR